MAKSKNITTMQLALMTAAAVISLRGLPMMAQEELTMFFYIFFATFLFLIPAALVGAELAAPSPPGRRRLFVGQRGFQSAHGVHGDLPPMDSERGMVSHRAGIRRGVDRLHDRDARPRAERRFRRTVFDRHVLGGPWVTLRGTATASGLTSKGFLIGTVLPGVVIVAMALAWIAGGNEIAFEHIPASVSQVVSADAMQHAHPAFSCTSRA